MSGELTRWLAQSPAVREQERAVARVQNHAEVAKARVIGVTQVAQSAMLGMLSVSMVKREASLLVPEDAAKFDLIATHAAMGLAATIQRLANQ